MLLLSKILSKKSEQRTIDTPFDFTRKIFKCWEYLTIFHQIRFKLRKKTHIELFKIVTLIQTQDDRDRTDILMSGKIKDTNKSQNHNFGKKLFLSPNFIVSCICRCFKFVYFFAWYPTWISLSAIYTHILSNY